jgi:hypothetical protein
MSCTAKVSGFPYHVSLTIHCLLFCQQGIDRQIAKVDSGLWMLADIEAWFLRLTCADASMDMEGYRRIVRHQVLALLQVSPENQAMLDDTHWQVNEELVWRANAILRRVHPLEGKDVSQETNNVLESMYA